MGQGFRRKTYLLRWPDGSIWSGLEVRLRGMNIGELEEVSELRNEVDEKSNLAQLTPLLDILEGAILSWNLEGEDGEPVPLGDFRKEDAGMLLAIIAAWTEVVGDIPPPSPPTSSDGGKSEEALMPMEIPSSSLPSLNMPNLS